MIEDFELCYRAVTSRDPRFDGRFFTAVTSTGIYCRPSCPAQTPRRENVRFYRIAGAAQAAGFRACKRCAPAAGPGSPEWNVRADLTGRALRLIAEGAVDSGGVTGLARRLAVSERHLHRLLVAEVGAGPLALARTRRAQTARLLVESTRLPLTEIAFAAGYGSVRQFNDGFRAAFGTSPSRLRARLRSGPGQAGDRLSGAGSITLRLRYRPPLHADALLGWFAARAVIGVEEVSGGAYRRSLRLPRSTAVVELTPAGGNPAEAQMSLRLWSEGLRDLATAVERCRALADLDADPVAVDQTLGADPMLADLVARRPGLRVPGGADGFELACRAVLGQQITVAGARTLAGRLTTALGERSPISHPVISHLFPTADRVAGATDQDLTGLGLTRARAATLRALAEVVAAGDLVLDRGADREDTVRRLRELPGVGPWTATYVAMRALGDPDAMPATDLVLRRTSARLGGPGDGRALEQRAARWRPWRAYAAMHLWAAAADNPDNRRGAVGGTAQSTTGGWPVSLTIGRPAATQDCMPPATLTAS
ncbi:MAG TPA: AlkA N-terminal domain-containing protein [Mycobacteriales bacterium]